MLRCKQSVVNMETPRAEPCCPVSCCPALSRFLPPAWTPTQHTTPTRGDEHLRPHFIQEEMGMLTDPLSPQLSPLGCSLGLPMTPLRGRALCESQQPSP